MDYRNKHSVPIAVISKALAKIAGARDRKDAIDAIRTSARSLVGCEGIAIILKDGEFCHYVEEDAIGPLWKGQKFPAARCVSGWSIINKATAIIPNIARDNRIPHELYSRTFVRAMAMAPVRAEDPIGAIGAYWSRPHTPTNWEVEILEAIADSAADVLGNHTQTAPNSGIEITSARTSGVSGDFARDIHRISGISAVPTILDVVIRMTGMGFAAVARVTESRWVACEVLDPVGFGLRPGDELPIESTLCNEIRDHRQTVVFDDALEDPVYINHHTPRIYGLRGYISEPIILDDGSVWGTLCAIDANPAKVKNAEVMGAFKLFAELIAHHLDADERLAATTVLLERERELAELREQFIAVLGHDLRNPIAAIGAGTNRLMKDGWTERSPTILSLMKASVARMSGLVENVLDLARARVGGGLVLELSNGDLKETLQHVVDELRVVYPHREISASFDFVTPVAVDHQRFAQMVSNLLSNAVTHGSKDRPVQIRGYESDGQLQIQVINCGDAIEPSLMEKLFQPFKRGDGKLESQGLGLGLYIASQIATAHSGDIDVSSDSRETCFTFTMKM